MNWSVVWIISESVVESCVINSDRHERKLRIKVSLENGQKNAKNCPKNWNWRADDEWKNKAEFCHVSQHQIDWCDVKYDSCKHRKTVRSKYFNSSRYLSGACTSEKCCKECCRRCKIEPRRSGPRRWKTPTEQIHWKRWLMTSSREHRDYSLTFALPHQTCNKFSSWIVQNFPKLFSHFAQVSHAQCSLNFKPQLIVHKNKSLNQRKIIDD